VEVEHVETTGASADAERRRDAMLEALAFAAQRFLEQPTWSECLDDVVCRLGTAVDASRAYAFENRPHGPSPGLAVLRSLWLAPDVTSPFSSGTEAAYDDLERWVELLSGGNVVAGPIPAMPPGERAHLEPHGIRSLLLVPVSVGGIWWGYIGFDDCERERVWPQVEVDLLRAAAGTLSAAIVRERAEANLRETEERYRALAEQLPAVTYREALHHTPQDFYISPRVREVFGYSPEEWTWGDDFWSSRLHPEDRERVLAIDAETNRTHEPYVAEYRFRRADGSYVWIHDEARLVERPDGAGSWQGFFLDITERKRVETTLERALTVERDAVRRLQAVDEMKNTFLQAVSHDLRTPLAAILGLAVTLQRGEVTLEADARDLASRIAANARKLDRMVTDLLDLDRLSRGIVDPKLHPTDVAELVRRVVAGSGLDASERVSVEAEPVVANVDAAKVERIVENLLANAIRHTHEDTHVLVRVLPAEGGLEIRVDDDGPGIPAELRQEVFEPFRQGPDAPEHAPGVGIGLALVARFAELMGGRAWIEESPSGGASFRVYLRDGPRTSAEVGSAG
jgi:PAS domain S-box-containing protein